jgi:hypothetical protein
VCRMILLFNTPNISKHCAGSTFWVTGWFSSPIKTIRLPKMWTNYGFYQVNRMQTDVIKIFVV